MAFGNVDADAVEIFMYVYLHGADDAGKVHIGNCWHAGDLCESINNVGRCVLEGCDKLPRHLH